MKGAFSRIQAVAKMVEGAISGWPEAMDWRRLSAVSLTPGRISAKRSVLAVHWTMILSRLCFDLNSLRFESAQVLGLGVGNCLPNICSDLLQMLGGSL